MATRPSVAHRTRVAHSCHPASAFAQDLIRELSSFGLDRHGATHDSGAPAHRPPASPASKNQGPGTGLFVEVPFDVKEVFGKARLPVVISVNGHSYRTTTSVYGGKYCLPVRKEHVDGLRAFRV